MPVEYDVANQLSLKISTSVLFYNNYHFTWNNINDN